MYETKEYLEDEIILAHGEDAEMWKNLDGCEEWVVCENVDAARTALANPPVAAAEDITHFILPRRAGTPWVILRK